MTIIERWKPVVGSNGRYEISSKGRVWSNVKNRYMCPNENTRGYLKASLTYEPGKIRTVPVHRLVAEHFLYKPRDKNEVNHKDGNKLNNHASNLEWVTASQNIQHGLANELIPRGEKVYNAKLTEAQAQEALTGMIRHGFSFKHYADKFGVSKSAIKHIKARRSWKHLMP